MGNSNSDIEDEPMKPSPITSIIYPDMLDDSNILHEDQLIELHNSLPGKLQCQPWRLTYSTDLHGYSLNTMFRNMALVDGPVLLIVKDFQNSVFGVLTSDPLMIKSKWYGRCESFLFTFKNGDFRRYGPTFMNENCIYCSSNCLMFGGSQSGRSGLYLNEDFCDGLSQDCDTYGNKPLANSEDFLIRAVEMWTFYEQY